jgi:fatty acid desaturase
MSTMTAPPPRSSRGSSARQVSLYTDLSRRIRDEGLLRRRTGWYAVRAAGLLAAFVVAFALLLTLGHTWWQLPVAALFGILFTQAAFLSHDGAHRQIFASGKANEWASRISGDLVVGLSYGWWMSKHSRHHANPNKVGADDDIAPGALIFTNEDAEARSGLTGWLTARQGWLFWPLTTLEGLNLHVSAVQTVLRKAPVPHRRAEIAMLAVRLIGWPVLVVATLGAGLGAAFLGVQLVVFGVYMAGCFAPSHIGMPIVPKDVSIDFLQRQVLMSRNIRGGRFVDWAMGGLNLQVEHHLFPSMPSVALREAMPLVREHCATHGVTYTEAGLFEAYGIVVRWLNEAGTGRLDAFDCPFAAQYR